MKCGICGVVIGVMLTGAMLLAADKPTTQPAAAPVNKKCPISGDDVNAKGKTVTYKGKVVGFCCDDCVDLFNKDPDKYADKIK